MDDKPKFDFDKAIDEVQRHTLLSGLKIGFIAGVVLMTILGTAIYFLFLRHHLK